MNFVSRAKVKEIIHHRDKIHEYIMELEKKRRYKPGAFVQLTLDEVTASDIWPESRTFSIASYKKNIMHFIIKKVGHYTTKIFEELKPGNYCTIKFPFGELFNKKHEHEKHLFLAGGVGVTPFLGLTEYFEKSGKTKNIKMLYSVKQENDLLHYKDLKDVLGNNLKIFVTQENTTSFNNRRFDIEDIMKMADVSHHIYICGSKTFNLELEKKLSENGFHKIHKDEWE